MTQLGSSGWAAGSASDDDEAAGREEDQGPELTPAARQILRTMGRRGGWHPDALCAATGMAFREVPSALLRLSLDGKVRHSFQGYEAVG